MSNRRCFRLLFWTLIGIGLLVAMRSSPAQANLSGSYVTFAPSVEYEPGEFSGACYVPGEWEALCFNLDTTSSDGQDAHQTALKFPSDWDVYGVNDWTPLTVESSCTNGGSMESMLYWYDEGGGQYSGYNYRVQNAGTSCHALYCFSVWDETDPGDPPYEELDVTVSWSWIGPPEGAESPTSACSSDGYYPLTDYPCEQQTAPAMLVPVCEFVPITILPEALPNATRGQVYNQQLSPENPDPNDPDYYYGFSGGMPADFYFYSNTGEIIWYNPQIGTYSFTVTVEGPAWSLGSREYTLVVDPDLIFNPETIAPAHQGEEYYQEITVTGGIAPYTLSLQSGTLPEGISFTDGIFTGTPTEAGTFADIVILAADVNGWEETYTYSLEVYNEHLFTWTPTNPASGEQALFTADDGFDVYVWKYGATPDGPCNMPIYGGFTQEKAITFYGRGNHKVCLEVHINAYGYVIFQDEQWVTVLNGPPSIGSSWTSPYPSFPDQPVEATFVFYDYDGGEFTCGIDWGDGTTDTAPGNTDTWYCEFPPHNYAEAGIYDLGFTITDDEGAFAESGRQHEVVYLYGDGGNTWLASNILTTTVELFAYAPLGTETLQFDINTQGEHGSLGVPEFVNCVPYRWTAGTAFCKAKVIYTPDITNPLYIGYDSYAFTASDVHGHTSVAVTNELWLDENEPPTAIDGEALVNATEPSQFVIYATDMDAYDWIYDDVSFYIDTPPQHGTLQFPRRSEENQYFEDEEYNLLGVEWAQLLTYIPNPGTTATTDTFTFHANDSHQDSNVATVNLSLHASVILHVNVNDDLVDAQGCDQTHCSLREAIADALVGDTIDFTLPLPNTITLTSDSGGQLLVDKNIHIVGPGAQLLSISAGFEDPEMNPWEGFRVFYIFNDYWPVEASISGLTIRDGRMDVGGGILLGQVSALRLTDSQIGPNNIVATAGGGLAVDYAELTMENCTVVGNEGTGTQGGAGIYLHFGTMTAINSTISDNITNNMGGGLLATWKSKATLIHTTISGNLANENYETEPWGGGGGIYSEDSTITLQNSIIAGNIDLTDPDEHVKWPDVRGNIISLGGNLIADGTGSTGWKPDDLVGISASPIDPMLGVLEIYEPGTTPTYPLLEGSPAIDSASCIEAVEFDQRGVTRPQGIACDSGAFELENPMIYLFIPLILR